MPEGKEELLLSQGYIPLCPVGDNIVLFNRSLFDYKSGCCGAEIHAETSMNSINFACKECGRGLAGAGVFQKLKVDNKLS